jgi:CubicO group peptidase (beta-lactamase class C family)
MDSQLKRSSLRMDEVAARYYRDAAEMLDRAVSAGELVGGAHLAFRNDKVVHLHSAGLRDRENRRPFAPDTVVRIYSMTKPIVAVAALTLWEAGKFRLEDPVSAYIPAFAKMMALEGTGANQKKVPLKRPILVRDLFRHTSGYSYGNGDPSYSEAVVREGLIYHSREKGLPAMLPPQMTIEKGADAMARLPLLHQPGEKFTYGLSMDLLGRLVEVWSGSPLDEFVLRTITAPLGMNDTGFAVPTRARNRFASCYTGPTGKLILADAADNSPFLKGFEFLSGGGGMMSTIKDYARFCQMLIGDGSIEGHRILRLDTVRMMREDQLKGVSGPFRFGLGFAIDDTDLGEGPTAWKALRYGWGGFASTEFHLIPDAKFFQIFVQQHVPDIHETATRVFNHILKSVNRTA